MVSSTITSHDHHTSFGRFLQGVARSSVQASAPGMREAVDSEGGFLIPGETEERLLLKITTGDELLRRCDIGPPPKGNHVITPVIDESSRADGSRFGAMAVATESEAATLTDSQPQFGRVRRELHKWIGLFYATDEMIENTDSLGGNIDHVVALEYGYRIAKSVIRGTGSGECLGVLSAPCTIEAPKVTNQTANTLQARNIMAMMARLWVGSHRTAVFLYHPSCLVQLTRLVDVGSYGSATVEIPTPLWD